MRVFISWSGPRSQAVAAALSDLLPDAIQDLKTWMSQHDIGAGSRWSQELSGELEASQFGILCLTSENLAAPWMLFEAGSLAKSVSGSRVVPYRLNLRSADVEFHLAQFQGVDADKEGTYKLLLSLNSSRDDPFVEERLRRVFEMWWPSLEVRLASVPSTIETRVPERDTRALLEEILQLVRDTRSRSGTVDVPHGSRAKTYPWKFWHALEESALASMSLDDLRDTYSILAHRWKESWSVGEEVDTDKKTEALQAEFRRRGVPVPEVFSNTYQAEGTGGLTRVAPDGR